MAAGSSGTRSIESSAWLAGLMLGAINGVMLLALGRLGLPLLALTLLLVAWKGPRLIATTGVVTGAGVVWAVLFARLGLACSLNDSGIGEQCDAAALAPWIAAAAAIFVAGLAGSALAFRRSRSRR